MLSIAFLSLLGVASSTTYFKETFDDTYKSRWIESNFKKSEGTNGVWKHTAGNFYGNKIADMGIQTSQDARFYAISSKLNKPVNSEGKTLVLQFQVRHPQKIDCGGGYIKLMPSTVNQETFNGDSEYYMMFGPDICGTTTRKTHVIFGYKGKNHLVKKDIKTESDQPSHVYTLIINPDNTYEVRIDNKKVEGGNLYDDFDMLLPRTIKDPKQSKPADWVDSDKMADPSEKKPAGWDDVPAKISDPNATMPDDWDEESDGKWEAPQIDNPEYKGEWKAKMIDNPNYKGAWVHPVIPNPDFVDDKSMYAFKDIGVVGFELWQVKAGSIFDNIIVTDSVAEAEEFLAETFTKYQPLEKQMFDEFSRKEREQEEAERKRVEEERKKQDAAKAASAGSPSNDDDDEEEDDEGVAAIKSKKSGKDEL